MIMYYGRFGFLVEREARLVRKEKQKHKTGSLGTQIISCIKRLKVDYKDIKSKTMLSEERLAREWKSFVRDKTAKRETKLSRLN